MEDIFITDIIIKEVRHLKNLTISLSKEERKHLILTGKNGSGKTSVLEILRDIVTVTNLVSIEESRNFLAKHVNSFGDISNYILNIQEKLAVSYNINRQSTQNKDIYFIVYYEAKRKSEFQKPEGVKKIDIQESYSFSDRPSKDFLQHIVNLKAQRSFAKDDNDMATVKKIDDWFVFFENNLAQIFEDETIKLVFDRENYNFYIQQKGRERFDFNTLSDGFAAIMLIVTDLIMRIENLKIAIYDAQGIVLIDEIETHLHIDLQKKILPFLTSVFPKIQFIVSTHSPFVLSSVPNAVVYDLEKQISIHDDLTAYSYKGLVESYYDSDGYSDYTKKQLAEYEQLINKRGRSEEEEERLIDLDLYFEKVPAYISPELVLKINTLRLSRFKIA